MFPILGHPVMWLELGFIEMLVEFGLLGLYHAAAGARGHEGGEPFHR